MPRRLHNGWVMSRPSDPKNPPSPGDRRSGRDRRQKDAGLPNGRERRRNVEARRPDVAEIEMTPSQWARLHAETQPSALDDSPSAAAPAPAKSSNEPR
jgi:hypothetical protein